MLESDSELNMNPRDKKVDKALTTIEKMNLPAKLKEVALNAPTPCIAHTVAERLRYQADLAEIVIHEKNRHTARAAAEHLVDPPPEESGAQGWSRQGGRENH